MRRTCRDKRRRQRISAQNSQDSDGSDTDERLISRKCSSGSTSFLNKYEKQIMQRSYSSDKKQSGRRKTETPTKDHSQPGRSGACAKVPSPRAKPHRTTAESDSSYPYAPPSPKPSIENIPKATHYKFSTQDDKKYRDSDEEPKYPRNAAAKYRRNIDDNLNYNRFNPTHNIHNNLSISQKYPSITRSRTGSDNLLSLQEYNKMLNNESQNSYGYFHGDKNNKLCYISNRPVYYDNTSISETMRYHQQCNELSIKNNSEFRMMSKSDTSIAQAATYCGKYQAKKNDENNEKVENYLSSMRNSHHNEKSILNVNPDLMTDGKIVTGKNSEITRLTNEIAKKLQGIGLNIHSTAEPMFRGKSKGKQDESSRTSSGKILDSKGATSKDSCGAAVEKDVNASMSCLRGDITNIEAVTKKSMDPARASKAPKYKQHSKYHLSNPETNDDNRFCHDSLAAKHNDTNSCCYREGEHVTLKPDLKPDLFNCCTPQADGRNICENLDVCDMQRVCKQSEEHHAKMLAHNFTRFPSCACNFSGVKCECGPDIFAKYGLCKNYKRSRSPLTAVNKKTNGVYVFVPLPENSNDPLEMSKHLQNIYNSIMPLNDKQDPKNSEKPLTNKQEGESQKSMNDPKVSLSEKPTQTPSKDSADNKISKTETLVTESETAKVKLINQLLDEYNLSLIKQLIQEKSPLKSIASRDDIAEELKKLKQNSVSRRHSDLNLNVDQTGKTALKPRKCPSESSFVMNYTSKIGADNDENNKRPYNTTDQFAVSSPDRPFAFQQLQQQHPMFFDPSREQSNNYQSINLPFTEFVSDLAKYRGSPQGTGQGMLYTRAKPPKSYHGQPPPPPPPPVFESVKPGQPLASSIIDPTIQFQSKVNAEAAKENSTIYSRPNSPSQTLNYGLDGATKKHHQQLIHHAFHQTHVKPPFDSLPESVTYGKVQKMPPYYPSGDVNYGTTPQRRSGLYDIQESVDYSQTLYDYSPTKYERLSVYDHSDYGYQRKNLKSPYYAAVPQTSGYGYDYPDTQTCHNHNFPQPYYRTAEHYHGDRFVDFHDNVHFIDVENEPKQPSILKKLQDVVAKPFSLFFKVETSNPVQNKSHLKGILKPTTEVENDESNDHHYSHKCGAGTYGNTQSRNTSNYDDMDLDNISQPPLEYVTVVDPYQTDSFESLHGEERRYAESSSSTVRNFKTSPDS